MRPRTAMLIGLMVIATLGWMPGPAAAQSDECSFPYTAEDVTGTEVTVESEPERIVTLNPSAAQTMWEIGGREKVVGLSKYAFYLDGAESRTNIWSGNTVNIEQVVALDPDLVLAPNTIPEDTVETLRGAGLTVFRFDEAPTIEFIYDKTLEIGRLTGECEGAQSTVDTMREDVLTIRRAVHSVSRPRVLYTFFGFTAGDETFVHEIITTAGGSNVAAEAGITGFRQISEEVVVERNPEWLLLNSDAPEVPDSAAYQGTDAAKNDNVVVADANYISQPAPRIVRPIEKLIQAMHPKAYRNAEEAGVPPGPSFTLTVPSLNDTVVEAGETTITANVTNTGSKGTFTALLSVNGKAKRFHDFEIESGRTEQIELNWHFERTGSHTVAINGKSLGTISVVESLPVTTPTPSPTAPTATPTPTQTRTPTATTETAPAESASPSPTGSPTATELSTTEPVDRSGVVTRTITETRTETSQPGFGPVIAVVALLAAGLLARRRTRPEN